MNIGHKMKELRNKENLTQIELCKRLNINQGNYSKYENSSNEPPLDLLINIAKFYNVSLDYLCGLETKSETKKIIINEIDNIIKDLEKRKTEI